MNAREWRRVVVGLSAALGLVLGACRREKAPAPTPVPAPVASTALDRLLPGELAEGSDHAMGLAVPRDMHFERVFDDSALARGRVGADALANYVRKRVDAATVEIAATRTLFPRAHVKGQPADKTVRIEVIREVDSTVLYLHDTTPPVLPPGLTDEERWRKEGVVPGKPFNPKAL
ncbi:MAG TPA: hypothetical protein VK550_35215 [Polyangiaceae bacterium]|nr:hypothetical protein [Polyangiaceae bacterium]